MKANSEIEDVVPKNERAGEAGPSAPANQETISGPETALVQDWYKAAGEVADFEGLGKALERVIRSFPGGVATTPHAHAAAALAVLKFMSGIPGMALDEATRKECMWILVQTLNGGAGEPMALLRYSDLQNTSKPPIRVFFHQLQALSSGNLDCFVRVRSQIVKNQQKLINVETFS